MLRNLRVRNWKANYRLARRTPIISHFQPDIQGISKIFSVTGKLRSNRQLTSAVRTEPIVRFRTKRIAPVPFSAGERDGGVVCVREPSGTVGNRVTASASAR